MRKPNYDKFPHTNVKGKDSEAYCGYEKITDVIKGKIEEISKDKIIIAVDCYHGIIEEEVLTAFINRIKPALVVKSKDTNYSNEYVYNMIERNLTDDRVRGVLSHHHMVEFFDPEKTKQVQKNIDSIDSGIVLIFGVGASVICEPDILIYADIARWELELRYRRGEAVNWCADNYKQDWLLMYKRGFFVDWPVADRHKRKNFKNIDYLLDTNIKNNPKMITQDALFEGLKQTSQQPFRVVPYFDAAPWGGQWMKEVCDLDKNVDNFGWCFDCVPEENSLFLNYGKIRVEMPSMNLVHFYPEELLGEMVYGRFGEDFPIRFDFLDTMGGGHLSLQVHPTTNYIQQQFGMHYTQDESYYILDAGNDACVYLGTKDGINKDEMIADLRRAQEGNYKFEDEKYVNKIPAKKHDHFLIPGGTVHCSGANSMVLEISATTYIFTFKLWDWDRLGLDGKPRPVHIEHGKNVINWDWTTETIMKKHVNCVEQISKGNGWSEEKTGLHEREFIETRRHWFTETVLHNTNGGVNVLNLVEGDEAIVESPSGKFEPYIVHYAETFIIPASVGEYTIRPYGRSEGRKCGTVKAYVRG
jgi:mannose-6-phosphate isomerase class I